MTSPVDPLAEVVTLLQPGAPFSKIVRGAGSWAVRRAETGQPFYCAILDGSCRLAVDGHAPIDLQAGDFVLVPSTYGFSMSSIEPAASEYFDDTPVALFRGEFRLGAQDGPPDVQMLVGYCTFGSPDATLLVSLLPQLMHVRGEKRLATLAQLVGDESREQRPARDMMLSHLLKALLIEALRSTAGTNASPGLLRGLADERLALALRYMHESPAKPWTVAQLAKEAALSRSAFFTRFSAAVGLAPMEYLLTWRIAMSRNLLLRNEDSVADIARRVGYGSASAFSVAFTRHVGVPPTQYRSRTNIVQDEAAS
ncbi:AraC family transcriptional regulator [Paraburkholderia sp. BCC1885]|uniref:AraC family transcriptional regulator n=1 Tax=Paraburkholderia sp. BCC1885 TaxID=2562669 RepID=UPI001183DF14|nr:AraC family transcriptional regulator [Paraburkholderia sp. BCC1885]